MKKPTKAVMTDRSARESIDVMESDSISEDAVARLSPPAPEVTATAKRRQFFGSEQRRILAAADRCTARGEIGALLRREGIYSSLLASWRKKGAATGRSGKTRVVVTVAGTVGLQRKRTRSVDIDPVQRAPCRPRAADDLRHT